VLEAELIPTSCNLFHNRDLYKYSTLPLPCCQIITSAQSVYLSSCLCLHTACYPVVPVFPSLMLQFRSLCLWSLSPVPRLVCLASLPWTPTLQFPWILLWSCLPCPHSPSPSLSPWFPATRPNLPWPAPHLPPMFNKYLSYLIPVPLSESPLRFTCFAPLNSTIWPKDLNPADLDPLHQTLTGQGALLKQHDQVLKTLLEHVKDLSQSLSNLKDRTFAQSSQLAPSLEHYGAWSLQRFLGTMFTRI
jgi:hypothetical protein